MRPDQGMSSRPSAPPSERNVRRPSFLTSSNEERDRPGRTVLDIRAFLVP
jgi:hypothetical protein